MLLQAKPSTQSLTPIHWKAKPSHISMNALYERIFDLCTQRGITPGKLCSELGISRGIMTDLKMGRKKDLYATTAYKIAKYFGVSVGYLLGYEDK